MDSACEMWNNERNNNDNVENGTDDMMVNTSEDVILITN